LRLLKCISDEVWSIRLTMNTWSKSKKLVSGSLLSCLAIVLQSLGALLPGIGYLVSPFATAPILLSSVLSVPFGLTTYLLTSFLLLLLQPSELFVFLFTTGLLGLGIGFAYIIFRKRINIIISGAVTLFLGIMFLLYILQFPVLGPGVLTVFSIYIAGAIFIFTFFYSWLWVELSLHLFIRLNKFIVS
jgi:hypothetical protein